MDMRYEILTLRVRFSLFSSVELECLMAAWIWKIESRLERSWSGKSVRHGLPFWQAEIIPGYIIYGARPILIAG
jgi:hypothetical protein